VATAPTHYVVDGRPTILSTGSGLFMSASHNDRPPSKKGDTYRHLFAINTFKKKKTLGNLNDDQSIRQAMLALLPRHVLTTALQLRHVP